MWVCIRWSRTFDSLPLESFILFWVTGDGGNVNSGLSGTEAGEEILGGDMGELTVFPLGPGKGEET
jgi:hypothetical protein